MAPGARRPTRRPAASAAFGLAALVVAGCMGLLSTPPPAGFPVNPCPVEGLGAVTPRAGYALIAPGQVVFAYEAWHNETPDDRTCGAQSVKGARIVIMPGDLASGALPWAATLQHSVPQIGLEESRPIGRLFRLEDAGPKVVERLPVGPRPEEYGATGNLIELAKDPKAGRYRFVISTWTGDELAAGEFELRP